MNKLRLPLLLLLAFAACSDNKLYPDAAKAFERHSYREYPAGEVMKTLESDGFNGLAALDRHAVLLKGRRKVVEAPASQESASGLLFDYRGGVIHVAKVFQHSPAAQAGIRDGDKVLEIDGFKASPQTVAERSDDSFGFTLKTERPGPKGPALAVAQVERERMALPLVFGFYEPASSVGYVRIGMFVQGSGATALSGVEALASLGAKKIVFDLRGNSGGVPEEAAELLAAFAPKAGSLMELKSRHKGYCKTLEARSRGKYADLKTAVLTDGRTAMAAEVFAQALKELAGARLVGGTTAGRVSMTRTFRLGKTRKGLELTVARLFPPSGLELEEKGAVPDMDAGLNREQEGDLAAAWSVPLETVLLTDRAYARAMEALSK
jgi:carboxyl-terminal processing protease